MAHNFRIAGDYYVSKAGSDANDGLTANTPKLTPQAAVNLIPSGQTKSIVMGSGVYKQTLSWGGKTPYFVGDGTVILQGSGSDYLDLSDTSGGTGLKGKNITIKGYVAVRFNFGNAGAIGFDLEDSFLFCNLIGTVNAPVLNFRRTALVNITTSDLAGSHLITISDCPLINCVVSNVAKFTNSYANQATTLSMRSTITPATFNHNNIRGNIIMNTGTVPASDGLSLSFAAHKTAYPTYNARSFSADPKYNSVNKLDFSLKIDSPHLNNTDTALSNIGGTDFGLSYYTSSDQLKVAGGALWSNVEQVLGDIKIVSGQPSGTLTTAALSVAGYIAEINKIGYLGALTFNKSFSGGTQENTQVPDKDTYPNANVSGYGNPDRLVVEARWSTQDSAPTIDAQWENQQYVTAGTYSLFEWNQKPMLDSLGRGNGDPLFNPVTGAPIAARWIQLRITLRNNYAA